MKLAVIIFHKNSLGYPSGWISKCLNSIRNQTYKDFDVFELDYGNEGIKLYAGSIFYSLKMDDHAQAHNFLLDEVFSRGYDGAFNVNIDDYYATDRFEKQIPYLEKGYDVISSNFYNIDDDGNIMCELNFDSKNITQEADNNHNIMAHPVLLYSKNFWTTCSRLKSNEIPRDDFELWRRSYGKYKFIVIPDFLLYYRVHQNKVSAK